MFCKYCGFELDDEAKFCPNCGKKVDAKKETKNNATKDSGYDISYDNQETAKSFGNVLKIVLPIFFVIALIILLFNLFINNNNVKSEIESNIESIKETIATDEYGRVYYMDENGKLKFNTWVHYDGNDYYVDSNGFVMKDAWIDNDYYVDKDGKKVLNDWCVDKNSGVRYYLGTDGKYIRGTIQTIDSKKYYFFENGIMAKSQIVPDFKDNKKLMIASDDGTLIEKEGDYTIQGKKYHIGKDGYVVVNNANETVKIVETTAPTQTTIPLVDNGTYDLSTFNKKIETAKVATKVSNYTSVNSFDTVKFGHYEQDNNISNGKEVLEWVVLEKNAQNQTALLWSKYILDHSTLSGIKAWLNNFYLNAFSNEDKMFVTNHEYENYGFTNMSILSEDELERYYYYNESLDKIYNYETLATQYAVVKGVGINQAGFGAFWYDVEGKGEFLSPAGFTPAKDKIGVRPCICVKYTGSVTEIGGVNEKGQTTTSKTGGILSIDSYENLEEEFFWGEDETLVIYTAKKPVFKGGEESELEYITEGIDDLMETLSSFSEDYVSRSNVKVRKISFAKPTVKTIDAKQVILEFSGTISLSGASSQTAKWTFTFTRESGDYKISRTQ